MNYRHKPPLHSNEKMVETPKVSIIIPVYNGANYLETAINCAISQTYENIEIIVVNDGSSDDGLSEKIAKKYLGSIKYISKKNGGVSSALNCGIQAATGDYFSWLSHDDEYTASKIESQIKLLQKNRLKNAIVYSGYEIIDSQSNYLYRVRPDFLLTKNELTIPLLPLLRGLINGCTLLIPLTKFREVGLFKEELKSAQDYELWFRMFQKSQLIYDSNVCVRTRIHPNQSTNLNIGRESEVNEIWIDFINKTEIDEIIAMNISPLIFYKSLALFLASMDLNAAAKIALQKQQKCHNHKKYLDEVKLFTRYYYFIFHILKSPANFIDLYSWISYLIKNDKQGKLITKLKYLLSK